MKSTLLLSVRPRYANWILEGVKRVELRRRLPSVSSDGIVVIYATAPVAAVVGRFAIQDVQRLPLEELWRQVHDIAGVTQAEYLDYFRGLATGVGIFVGQAQRFRRSISLDELRVLWPRFQPPQGFRYLEHAAVKMLCSVSEQRIPTA